MIKSIIWEFIVFIQISILHLRYYCAFAFLGGQVRPNVENEYLVINSVRSYIPVQLAIELKIALHASRKGTKIVFLFDDNLLLSHDTFFGKHLPSKLKQQVYNAFVRVYQFFGIQVYFYSAFKPFTSDDKLAGIDKYYLKDY